MNFPMQESTTGKMRDTEVTKKKKRSYLRLFAFITGGLLLLAAISILGGALWIRHSMSASLPDLDGENKVKGLAQEVAVRRDGHGVPHLSAQSLDDLFIAQGYVTAQDRLWQMDMLRRNAAGELAEVLGPKQVEHDRTQRLLLLRATAERIVATLSPRDRRFFEDYAKGVNQYIDEHSGSLPAEFRVLAYSPKTWTPVDSIVIGLSMVQMLDEHFEDKLSREQITARLGSKLAADLYPTGSWRDHPPISVLPEITEPQPLIPDIPLDESQTKLEDLIQLRKALHKNECESCAYGSNQWAISGVHTASGRPLLSNDMHLGISVPNIWYEADLKAQGYHAAGVTLPGMPFIIAGHNEHVAWGFTALYADTQDLYVENLNGHGEYEAADGWHAVEHVEETIRVRGGVNVGVDVQKTNHGPIISPMLKHEKRALALHWNIYDPTISGLPLFDVNTASNWLEFRTALQKWWGPTQNVVYSDDQGHIGYQAVGYIPYRPTGISPIPVSDRMHDWQGFIPFDSLPTTFDPPSGILATANSRVTPDDYSYALTLEWASPYRTERIYKWLAGKNQLTRQDMLTLQTDIYSEVNMEIAQRLAYAIDHTENPSDQVKQAADFLRVWDGTMTENSVAASIVTNTLSALWPILLEPKLGSDWQAYKWPASSFAEEEIIMHASANWLPKKYKDWNALMADAVKKGLDKGNAPHNLKNWTYGSWHIVDLEHPLFGMMPWFKQWTGTGVHPLRGDHTTVRAAGKNFGASQRFTMDWSNIDGSTENISMGQSGNPLSPYYRDQWTAWYNGSTFTLPFTDGAVQASTKHVLRLVP